MKCKKSCSLVLFIRPPRKAKEERGRRKGEKEKPEKGRKRSRSEGRVTLEFLGVCPHTFISTTGHNYSVVRSWWPAGPPSSASLFMSSRRKIALSSCPFAGSIELGAPGFWALSPGFGILRCRFLYNCYRPPRESEMVRPTPQLRWRCHRICHAGVFQE